MQTNPLQFKLAIDNSPWKIWLHKNLNDEITAQISHAIIHRENSNVKVFKDDASRYIYTPVTNNYYLIKIYKLPRLKDRLRPWRFAQAEMSSHLLAESHGVRCPKLLGCFECKHPWNPLPVSNGIIVEFLDGWHESTELEYEAAVAILKNLYESGINHPDFMRKNIMVKNNTPCEAQLIDLEGCTAIPPKNIKSLLMQTQRYVEFSETGLESPLNAAFVKAAASITPNIPVDKFVAAIAVLLKSHRSRYERRNLVLPQECLNLLHD